MLLGSCRGHTSLIICNPPVISLNLTFGSVEVDE